MEYKKNIAEMKERLKGVECRHLGNIRTGNAELDRQKKRQAVLLGMYEEMQRIEEVNDKLQNPDTEAEPQEKEDIEEYREPLSIEKETVYTILLSWGGPSDGFKLRFKDNDLLSGVYFLADWGEYEEQLLSDEESRAVYDFYMYGDVSAFQGA